MRPSVSPLGFAIWVKASMHSELSRPCALVYAIQDMLSKLCLSKLCSAKYCLRYEDGDRCSDVDIPTTWPSFRSRRTEHEDRVSTHFARSWRPPMAQYSSHFGTDASSCGRRVKPVKPRETRDETTWQACETSETGRNNRI